MLLRLQPLGGIAGDMFIAAMLDAFPQYREGLFAAIRDSGLGEDQVTLRLEAASEHGLSGSRFHVTRKGGDAHAHTHFSEIRTRLQDSALDAGVVRHALGIFTRLAEAEARVHDKPVDTVAFHEVGAWDSIADIVGAAWLIHQCEGATWHCAPLPLGSGTIEAAHGILPVPAPATALLLEGMPTFDDGLPGERVTPTGAAILRYLEPGFVPAAQPAVLRTSGTGFGSRRFANMANQLRVLVFDPAPGLDAGQVGLIEFEVDDQSPEELAAGLERLRRHEAVFDVLQQAVYAKKGRLASHIRILCEPQRIDAVATACFEQTTTLGLRWQQVNRLSLAREESHYTTASGERIRVKTAERPAGRTAKAELDDVLHAETAAGRRRLRREAESAVQAQEKEDGR